MATLNICDICNGVAKGRTYTLSLEIKPIDRKYEDSAERLEREERRSSITSLVFGYGHENDRRVVAFECCDTCRDRFEELISNVVRNYKEMNNQINNFKFPSEVVCLTALESQKKNGDLSSTSLKKQKGKSLT